MPFFGSASASSYVPPIRIIRFYFIIISLLAWLVSGIARRKREIPPSGSAQGLRLIRRKLVGSSTRPWDKNIGSVCITPRPPQTALIVSCNDLLQILYATDPLHGISVHYSTLLEKRQERMKGCFLRVPCCGTILSFVFLACSVVTTAFVCSGVPLKPYTLSHAAPFLVAPNKKPPPNHPLYYASSEDANYSDTECQEMRNLILSLSLEPTDHDRRKRVKKVFHEALARPNGMPKRFTDLFDKILIEVGDEVQNEAKKKFFEDQATAAPAVEATADNNDQPEDEDMGPPRREKTPTEMQLWALVDMMVQTKTIVKRENGELGNKGTFQ